MEEVRMRNKWGGGGGSLEDGAGKNGLGFEAPSYS